MQFGTQLGEKILEARHAWSFHHPLDARRTPEDSLANPPAAAVRLSRMEHKVIQYRTKPGRAEENERLIEAVFRELHTEAPVGIHYGVIALEGGAFVHIVHYDEGAPAMTSFEAFDAFQENIEERQLEAPVVQKGRVIGNYGMFGRDHAGVEQ